MVKGWKGVEVTVFTSNSAALPTTIAPKKYNFLILNCKTITFGAVEQPSYYTFCCPSNTNGGVFLEMLYGI